MNKLEVNKSLRGLVYKKDSAKRTVSVKRLKDRAYEVGRNLNYDRYQRALASMVYKFLDKKTGSGVKASVNEELTQELH